jgi:hypothetical protein
MAIRRRSFAVIGLAAVAVGSFAVAVPANARSSTTTHHHLKIINYQPRPRLGAAPVPGLSGGLPTFTASQADHGSTFKYTMVGKNPKVAQTSPVTTVTAELIPVKIVVTGASSDPTLGNSCDSTSATARTTASPIVKSFAWSFGGTSIGTGQYTDAFQRAEFWKFTQPSGINPGYHVKLSWTKLAKRTITVPAGDFAIEDPTSCKPLIGVDVNWLDPYLQNTVLPALTNAGLISAKTFPFFLVNNVVEYQSIPSNCCILGYHNAYTVSNGVQTYGIADYDNTGDFSGVSDVEVATHEVAEWMNDPTGANPTKPWGNIGQVSGCQNNLEVGDPLTGTSITRTVGTFTYHLQELAFFSWFYHQSPSIGVHGWYSSNGSFTTAAAACT